MVFQHSTDVFGAVSQDQNTACYRWARWNWAFLEKRLEGLDELAGAWHVCNCTTCVIVLAHVRVSLGLEFADLLSLPARAVGANTALDDFLTDIDQRNPIDRPARHRGPQLLRA